MSRYSWLVLGSLWLFPSTTQAQGRFALPDGAVAQLGVHRLRVQTTILATAFAPDQRTLIVVLQEPSEKQPNVVLFDVTTGLERRRLDISGARQLAVARHKPLMVLETTRGFEVWDLATEKRVKEWRYPDRVTNGHALAISPDGTQVLAAAQQRGKAIVLRWDVTTAQALPPVYPSGQLVDNMSFSGDGSKFFTDRLSNHSGTQRTPKEMIPGAIITWNAKTGTKLAELRNHQDYVTFSADGSMVARGVNEQYIEIINLTTHKRVTQIDSTHLRFAFTPDGKQLVVVPHDQPVRLWDTATGKLVRTFEGNTWYPNLPPQFTQDGRLLAITKGETWQHDVRSIQLWDMSTGKQVRFSTGHPSTVNGLAYSADGRWLASISHDTIVLFDPKTGEELRRWIAHKAAIEQIAFAADGKLLASASIDGTVALWEPATGKERQRFTAKDSVKALAFTLDGSTLVAINKDHSVQNWDVVKGRLLSGYQVPFKMASPAMSPTGQFLACFEAEDAYGNFGTTLHLMRARSGKHLLPVELAGNRALAEINLGPTTVGWAFRFSPDAKLLATSESLRIEGCRAYLSNHTVRIWETATRREILHLANNPIAAHLLAISPDGRILAHGIGNRGRWGYGKDQTIILRDISSGQSIALGGKEDRWGVEPEVMQKLFRPIGGNQGSITCMTFSPDSKYLATGGTDQVALIWRVEDFLKRSTRPATKEQIADVWPHLADLDAGKAYQAIAAMETRPKETIALLRRNLRPVPIADEKTISAHVRALASANFAVRQQAYLTLEKTGEQAAHLMQEAIKNPPNLEVKRRLETLLEKLDQPLQDTNQLRVYRCLILLERIATPEARQLIQELAQGAPGAWVTKEARDSVQRLKQGKAISRK